MSERDMRQEWETPDDFFGVVNEEFDFQIDVCATKENAKCKHFHSLYDGGIDALKEGTPWIMPDDGILSAWCNPGFSKPGPWVRKAYREAQKHHSAAVVVMGLISPSTEWWMRWAMKACRIRLIGGKRLQFKAPRGIKRSSNAKENCVMIFHQVNRDFPVKISVWDWTKDLP